MQKLDTSDPATADFIAEVLVAYAHLGLIDTSVSKDEEIHERLKRSGLLRFEDGACILADPRTVCVVDFDDDGTPLVGPRASQDDLIAMAESALEDALGLPETNVIFASYCTVRDGEDEDGEWEHFADEISNQPTNARQAHFEEDYVATPPPDARVVILEARPSGGLSAIIFPGSEQAIVVIQALHRLPPYEDDPDPDLETDPLAGVLIEGKHRVAAIRRSKR